MKDQIKTILYKSGILLLLILVLSNLISFLGLAYVNTQGLNYVQFIEQIKAGEQNINLNTLRVILSLNQVGTFLLPALVFAYFINEKKISGYFSKSAGIASSHILWGIILLILCLPLVQASFYLNKIVPLPQLMHDMEESSNLIMGNLIGDKSMNGFIFNILLIGILPSIGEELLFRGVILNEMIRGGIKPITAVIISAIIFSAFHMQFASFLPRFILGVLLAYLYIWSGSILLPMIIHFINNTFQVVAIYAFDIDPLDMPDSAGLSLYLIAIVAGILLYLSSRFARDKVFKVTENERS